MIHTVTLNSGFDDIYRVSNVVFGGVGDLSSHTTLASGKGVNAARIAHALGAPVTAYALVGAADEQRFRESLTAEGIECRLVTVDAATRHNVTLISMAADQPSAHFRAPGFRLVDSAPITHLVETLRREVSAGDVVTLNGSCPVGLGHEVWREIGQVVVEKGGRLVADIQSESLVDVLSELLLAACKPNDSEMYDLPDVAGLERWDAVRAALRYMEKCDVELPIVTLGADGVAYTLDDEALVVTCPVEARVTVGAGDAFTAALAVEIGRRGRADADAVREATAVASAFVTGIPVSDLPGVLEEFRFRVDVRPLGDR